MSRVNLLPVQYVERRLVRRRRRMLACVMAVACVVMGGWGVLAMKQAQAVSLRIGQARQALVPLKARWQVIEATEREVQAKMKAVALLEAVRQPLDASALLALVSQQFPKEGALLSLVVQMPDVQFGDGRDVLKKSMKAAGVTARQRGGAVRPEQALRAAGADVLQISLEGVVVSDMEAAALARRLSDTGLFRHVRIEDAQQLMIGHERFHQFRLSAELPLVVGGGARMLARGG